MLEFLKRWIGRPAEPQHSTQVAVRSAVAGQKQAEAHQQHAEANLRLSEEHLRLLIEGVQEYAIFMLDPGGNVATWNSGAERIKGYSAGEIIGRHFSKFYPPEEIAAGKPQRELEIAAATGKYEEEGYRLRKDGSQFWASVVITALRDSTGTLVGFAKVTRDMTERRRSEENARRLFQEEAARAAAEASRAEALAAQEQARQRGEQLHVTLSSIGDAVIVTDAGGTVTFINPIAEVLTGWSPADAAGKPLEQVFHIVNEQTKKQVENPVTKVLREGIVVGLANHTILIARDGREVPIDDSAAPIRGADGTIGGVVMVFRDVTELRQAMAARLSLAAIVETSDDAIISKSLEGIITSWNRGAERLFGYTAQEMVGQPLARLVPPEQADELPAIMNKLKAGERIEHFETVRLRKDGERLRVSLSISPIKNSAGVVIGASKISRDITASKRQEADLRFVAEASKLLAKLDDERPTLLRLAELAVPHFADWCTVDLLDERGKLQRLAVAHVDPAKVELANELHRRFPPEPETDRGAWRILRTGKSEWLATIPSALIEATVKEPEVRQILYDLGLKSYIGVPLVVRGKPVGVVTFISADSGRQYRPEDVRLAEDLAARASIALENLALYRELKEADRRKDEFLAMLAHELRNPLAPIRSALQVMSMPGASVQAVEEARTISERQVQHMVRLVDDLLDVSRIMRGHIELRRETVELATVIGAAVETSQPAVDAMGQKLTVTLPTESLRLYADPARITQVIANLLNNAARFSSLPGRIWLSAEREGNDVLVRVKDEGSGIAPELLPNVFDLFVQGDKSLDRAKGGLGIGLTVVTKLVEMHAGRVTAHSAGLGHGSEFVVRLPLAQESSKAAQPVSAAPATPAATGRNVLVVDDNVDAADSIAMLLRMYGHKVSVAYTGPQALASAESHGPEAIVLDIGLPGISGYEVAKKLREQSRFEKTVLIALTGYGQEDDRRRSMEAGFNYHLTKPVTAQKLQSLLVPVTDLV